jgi:hypothetical protein
LRRLTERLNRTVFASASMVGLKLEQALRAQLIRDPQRLSQASKIEHAVARVPTLGAIRSGRPTSVSMMQRLVDNCPFRNFDWSALTFFGTAKNSGRQLSDYCDSRFKKVSEIRARFAPGSLINPRPRFCYVISVTIRDIGLATSKIVQREGIPFLIWNAEHHRFH